MFTLHEDEALHHAYFSPEGQTTEGSIRWTNWLLLKLWRWLWVRWALEPHWVHDTIFSNVAHVSWLLSWSEQKIESVGQVPAWFREVVKILKKYDIGYRVNDNKIVIIYGRYLDANLIISYNANRWIYTEHYYGIQSKYRNIYELMKRIEDHDFQIMSIKEHGFQRRSFTDEIPLVNSQWAKIWNFNQLGSEYLTQATPWSEQSWSVNTVSTTTRVAVSEIVSKIGTIKEAFSVLSIALGTKIPYELKRDKIIVRYLENDRSKDITILYDEVRGEFSIQRSKRAGNSKEEKTVFPTLSSLLVFLVEDHSNIIDHIEQFGNRQRYLRIAASWLSIESWFNSRVTSIKSNFDISQLDIQNWSAIVQDLTGTLSAMKKVNSESPWNPEITSDQLKKYIIAITQEQRRNHPDQYKIIRWDSEWFFLWTAILIKAMGDNIDTIIAKGIPSETALSDILSIIWTYITLRETFPDETCQAWSAYFSDANKDILNIDKRVRKRLEIMWWSSEAELVNLRNRKEEISGEKKVLEWTQLDGTYSEVTINSIINDLDLELIKVNERIRVITEINEWPLLQYSGIFVKLRQEEIWKRKKYQEEQAKRMNPIFTWDEELRDDPFIRENYFRRNLSTG